MSATYKTIMAFLIAVSSMAVSAEDTPTAGTFDNRIRHVIYNPDEVYKLMAHFLVETNVVFAPDEVTLYIGAGDPTAWSIEHSANHVFIKPKKPNADTNIKIITNHRTYNFEAVAREKKDLDSKNITFELRFDYPAQMTDKLDLYQVRNRAAEKALQQSENRVQREVGNAETGISVDKLNFDYTMSGDTNIAPIRAFDDGQFTYFQFREEVSLPAILAVDDSGKAILVNYFPEGPYIKVHRMAAQFVLLYDDVKVCVWNEAFRKNMSASTLKRR